MRLALLAITLLLGLGCQPSIPEGRFACESDEDCPPEMVCRLRVNRCYLTPESDGG